MRGEDVAEIEAVLRDLTPECRAIIHKSVRERAEWIARLVLAMAEEADRVDHVASGW